MTRKELSEFLGYTTMYTVSMAVAKAKKEMPSIATKYCTDPWVEVSFSKEEINCIARHIDPPLNDLQLALISENYIQHDKTYLQNRSPYIEGTVEFLARYDRPEIRKQIHCCACCAYLCGKSIAGTTVKLLPYCTFYDKFISRMKTVKWGKQVTANIFIDGCESFARAKKLVLFRK